MYVVDFRKVWTFLSIGLFLLLLIFSASSFYVIYKTKNKIRIGSELGKNALGLREHLAVALVESTGDLARDFDMGLSTKKENRKWHIC